LRHLPLLNKQHTNITPEKIMPEIFETFSTYRARVEQSLQGIDTPIILSTDIQIPILRSGDDRSIEKVPIAWPLFEHSEAMWYSVTVPPGKSVPLHSHEEDIFRYVVKGSLVLNGTIQINEGMWFVVKANTPYEIFTEGGFEALFRYQMRCRSSGAGGTHWIDD
jgi:hypothetical protein